MKKQILFLTMIVFVAGTISTLYGLDTDNKSIKSGRNIQETNKNSIAANLNVHETQYEAFSVYHEFLKDAEIKINQNKKIFADYEVMLSKINQKDKTTCLDKVKRLEQNNNNLGNILADHKKDQRQDKWTSYKRDFNLAMDKLEKMMWGIK